MNSTTMLLVTAMTLTGLLVAPAALHTTGIDAPGADVAPGTGATTVEMCAGGERPEPGDPKPMIVPGQCVGIEIER